MTHPESFRIRRYPDGSQTRGWVFQCHAAATLYHIYLLTFSAGYYHPIRLLNMVGPITVGVIGATGKTGSSVVEGLLSSPTNFVRRQSGSTNWKLLTC